MHYIEVATLIPILAIVLGIGIGTVAIITEHKRKARELEHRHLERMAAIEKGLDLPPEPARQSHQTPRERYLLRGLIWLGVGLAMALALPDLVGDRVAQVGWIVAAVGAAFLVFYAAEGRKKPQQPSGSSGDDASPQL